MEQVKYIKNMINSGANNLYNNHTYIDKLNVFPVPDGDTGTNMNLTTTNAILSLDEEPKATNIGEVAQKFARGLIMGARGNSGVIFSQVMKGFAKGLENETEFNITNLKNSFLFAKEFAYKAVMKPVEGTILTVIREIAEQVNKLPDDIDVKSFWKHVIEYGNISLENTPNLLEVLKSVGVVDSGAYGLMKFFEGVNTFIQDGKVISKSKKIETNEGQNIEMDLENDEFGYCTEAIVMLNSEQIKKMDVNLVRKTLESFENTSIVAVKDEDILKVHTHALVPGQVLTYLQQFGDFKTIKVENMTLQADYQVKGEKTSSKTHQSTIKNQRSLVNDYALIAVTSSQGMQDYFKNDLNFDYVINAGPKMNPSTSDFIKAIEEVDAKNVFLFPNDSNVILAAEQARNLETKSKVFVIPSKTIPQGIISTVTFDPSETPRKNAMSMTKALKNVVSFYVFKAVKTTRLDGVDIKEGQYTVSLDKKIVFASNTMVDVFNKCLAKQITIKTELLTIFIGEDSSQQDIIDLRKLLDENFDVEYELVESGQKNYNFIIAIE